ncbi:MAG: Ig-like domain-containing protein, partial [Clostridia bacterium]|nr:Ig-like domain-containing protein [Clostridia bacterium]
MKRRTRKALISTLACGLLGISAIGVTGNLKAAADSVAVKPTGTNTTTLTQAINDADLDSFKVYGASTRTKEPNGFRFLAVIDGNDLALIPNDAEFGLLIIPTAMLGEEELTVDTQNALIAPAKVNTTAAEIPDGGMGYYITLMGETLDAAFPQGLYNTVFTARAYAEYKYEANGETVIDYAYSQSALDRSIAYVASCELVDLETKGNADTNANSFLNKIISEAAASAELSLSQEEVLPGDVVTVELQNATDGVNAFKYTLSSSNEAVATINENGEVEAVGAGKTEITATIGATKITKTLKVKGLQSFTAGNILYSTADGEIFMPNGLLDDGESIISAVDTATGEIDYLNKGKWSMLALTVDEIKENAVRQTELTVQTSQGDLYMVNALSYAGVIDELSDFPKFFNNEAVASEFDAA